MPTEFKVAFANARKQGLKTFNHEGKPYSTKYREEKVIDDILTEYPAMGRVYNQNNTKISIADAKRQELNKKIGGGGGIEHWFPDDPGPKDFPHPSLGKYNLEFFDQELFEDTPTMKNAAYLDMLHGMKADDGFKKLRDEFNKNWKPEELEFVKKKYLSGANKGESFASYVDRTAVDGYLRGGLNPMNDISLQEGKYVDEYAQLYRGHIKENGKTIDPYSKSQREVIKKMQEYLKKK